jgi:hypothetical protein
MGTDKDVRVLVATGESWPGPDREQVAFYNGRLARAR